MGVVSLFSFEFRFIDGVKGEERKSGCIFFNVIEEVLGPCVCFWWNQGRVSIWGCWR